MQDKSFNIRSARWAVDKEPLLAVRTEVFVIEQKVPEEIEVDEFDPVSLHVLASDAETGTPVGTARLLPNGRIGRVAVLKPWRKSGVGAEMMRFLISEAKKRGDAELMLHAQTWTIGFYETLGFVAEGPEFDEADIPHRTMRLVF